MTLTLKRFEIDSPEDIVGALIELAEIDADFNGENGEEYLWDRAKDAGYKTNAEYLANLRSLMSCSCKAATCLLLPLPSSKVIRFSTPYRTGSSPITTTARQ